MLKIRIQRTFSTYLCGEMSGVVVMKKLDCDCCLRLPSDPTVLHVVIWFVWLVHEIFTHLNVLLMEFDLLLMNYQSMIKYET